MRTVNTGLEPEWYTPEDEQGDDKPTRYRLRPLTQVELADVSLQLRKADGSPDATGLINAFKTGTIGWENLVDRNNRPLDFSDFNKRHVPVDHIYEIGGRVIEMSGEDEDDVKK